MNPFDMPTRPLESTLMDWDAIRPVPYNKHEVDPYTRTRVILMNGTEFEANWFTHQLSRNCDNNAVRRTVALIRRSEQQQQKLISLLKPADETLLEHTIGYEQLAVDLTAHLAQREPDPYVKQALDFALLEDFDHLYRYANFLDLETGEKAEHLVGRYTEIIPGRPTIAHYRHPYDSIRYHINNKQAHPQTRLCVGIITGAEQQTMNYYMNVCTAYPNDRGRFLYQEIGMVEEQHVTHYGSLMDPNATWLENLLLHEYTEAYLYYSCMETETNFGIKKIWEKLFEQEISHLHAAANMLYDVEHKTWQEVLGPNGNFPAPLQLQSNIHYVREIQEKSVQMTAVRENYQCVNCLPSDADFFRYQRIVNDNLSSIQSHTIIEDEIRKNGMDYRFELAPNPIPPLRDRTQDNTEVGRVPCASDACRL